MPAVWSSVNIAQGETVIFLRDDFRDDYTAYEYQQAAIGAGPINFLNYGTIRFTADFPISPYATLWSNGQTLPIGSVVENHGVILVEAKIGYASGFLGGGAPFTNTGQITIRGQLAAEGLRGSSHAFTNSGQILVEARDEALGLHSYGNGPVLNNGDLVVRVTGPGDARAIQMVGSTPLIENNGLIMATHPTGAGHSLGISFGLGLEPTRIINRGTITADDALIENSSAHEDPQFTNAQHVENTGTINGRVALGLGADRLTNSKLMDGAVDLGSGDDLYDGRLGRVTGMVGGGEGADTLLGGDGFDYLHGNAGADSIVGGLGVDWVVGGKDNDYLSGEAGDDVVYANLGADTGLGGDGADWVRGGQDNDSLSGGGGNDLIWGDRGDDTLSGGTGADTFSTFAGAGLERILDFSLADGDRLIIEGGAAYSVRKQGADTVVDLGGGDLVVLADVDLTAKTGWIFSA